VTRTRKVLLVIAVAFVIYAVYNNPDKSATTVRSIFDLLVEAVKSIGKFFDRILTG
jgi:hypothetical protein